MVVGMLAALRAGAAYVPLVTGAPVARLRRMVRLAGVCVVAAAPWALELARTLGTAAVVPLEPEAFQGKVVALDFAAVVVSDLAQPMYTLFTTGSTGTPKPVFATERAA